MKSLALGALGLAVALAPLVRTTAPGARARLEELAALNACLRPQAWSINVRPRETVRVGAEFHMDVALSGGPDGGRFRVSLRAPAGTLVLALPSWDETLDPGTVVVRELTATCATGAPVPVVAKLERLDPGFELSLPAQQVLTLLPLPANGALPDAIGWDPATGRPVDLPGIEHVKLASGERVTLIPAVPR